MKRSVALKTVSLLHGKCLDSELWKHKMFSKAVYSKLEFSSPMSRKKISNFNFFFPLQNGFLAVPVYSVMLKPPTVSALSGGNQGHFLSHLWFFANKLTWQFTVLDADR